MTYAHFKRMKPKYKRRFLLSLLIMFALFVAVVFGAAAVVSAVRTQLNTTTLKDVTAKTVLHKENMTKILAITGQEDAGNLLVTDSELTLDSSGAVSSLSLHFVNLTDKEACESWQLSATPKKATLRKLSTEYENRNAMRLRNVEFKTYYPALSRVTSPHMLTYLKEKAPVKEGGIYTFTDAFDNNLTPEYVSYLERGLSGVWVSRIGAVSEFNENFKPVAQCAPTVVSVKPAKEKGKTQEPAAERFIVLLEAAPYS